MDIFFISKITQLDAILISGGIKLFFSNDLIEELKSIISKPKLKKYFGEDALEEMLNTFNPYIDFINIKSEVSFCRDPKDDFLLALAKDGKADYLLTGDKDLLELDTFEKTKIITITNFFKKV